MFPDFKWSDLRSPLYSNVNCILDNIFCQSFSLKDADQDILDSDEDEIDEDSAVYLESLQEKVNKHMNGSMQVHFNLNN